MTTGFICHTSSSILKSKLRFFFCSITWIAFTRHVIRHVRVWFIKSNKKRHCFQIRDRQCTKNNYYSMILIIWWIYCRYSNIISLLKCYIFFSVTLLSKFIVWMQRKVIIYWTLQHLHFCFHVCYFILFSRLTLSCIML